MANSIFLAPPENYTTAILHKAIGPVVAEEKGFPDSIPVGLWLAHPAHLPLSPAACTPVHRGGAAVPPYVCLPNRYIAAKVPCTSTPVPAHSSVRCVTLLIDLNDAILSIKCGSIP